MADADLKAALLAAKKKPMNFALVVRGGEAVLTVSKKAIVAKDIKEMKEDAGGGKTYEGVVEGDDKGLVFKVSGAPPASLDRIVKKCIREDAGLSVAVSFAAG